MQAQTTGEKGSGDERLRPGRPPDGSADAVRRQTLELIHMLEVHWGWEETTFYPLLQKYFALDKGPSIMPSIWVLERDHELAAASLEAFLGLLEEMTYPPAFEIMGKLAKQLIQACQILRSHLDTEEELILQYVQNMVYRSQTYPSP
ncbi:hemerythrin domain-containing protein [Paenibacillus sp. P26]|nr:hemerythrin domain-containing protein [Paenibacillus sp. P26]